MTKNKEINLRHLEILFLLHPIFIVISLLNHTNINLYLLIILTYIVFSFITLKFVVQDYE
jgi:hypothetical protein